MCNATRADTRPDGNAVILTEFQNFVSFLDVRGGGVRTGELLRQRVHGWEARNVAMWLVRRRGDLTLREIGSLFGGIDYAAVSQRIRRVEARMHRQKHLFKTCQILNV